MRNAARENFADFGEHFAEAAPVYRADADDALASRAQLDGGLVGRRTAFVYFVQYHEPRQLSRAEAFERFEVTDDHCMAIIGTARDGRGRLYFVCKNSWGTDNPYGGLMYMSEQYFRLNTVAVVMKADKPAPAHVGS